MGNNIKEMVEFKANGGTASGYLVRPDGDGPFPGVVVIQEWWGLNGQIKGVADRFAEEGFAALAPDLYHGVLPAEPDDARKLVMGLNMPQTVKDIQGAVNYLAAQSFIEPKKIGVMGFCMGGSLAFGMAYAGKGVGAVVVFYGGGNRPPSDENLRNISAPILGLFGAEDHGIPAELIHEWESKLKAYDKTNEMVIYPGAGHAFFNEERPSYDAEASADAWRRTLDWLRRWLPPD